MIKLKHSKIKGAIREAFQQATTDALRKETIIKSRLLDGSLLTLRDPKHFSFVGAMVHVEMKDGIEYYLSQASTFIRVVK